MESIKNRLKKYKNEIIFALLVLYVIILGFGVIGELFDVRWILNLPLFKI